MFFKLDCKDVPKISYILNKHPDKLNYFAVNRKDMSRTSVCYFDDFNSKNLPSSFKSYIFPNNPHIINSRKYFNEKHDFNYYFNENEFSKHCVNYKTLRIFLRIFKSVIYGKHYNNILPADFNEKRIWSSEIGPLDTIAISSSNILKSLDFSCDLIQSSIIVSSENLFSFKLESIKEETLTQYLQKIYITLLSSTLKPDEIPYIENSTLEKYANLSYKWFDPNNKFHRQIPINLSWDDNNVRKFIKMVKYKRIRNGQ